MSLVAGDVTESPLETTSTYEYEASAETEEPPSESSGCVPFRYGEEIETLESTDAYRAARLAGDQDLHRSQPVQMKHPRVVIGPLGSFEVNLFMCNHVHIDGFDRHSVTEQPPLVTPGPHLGPIVYEAPTEQPPMNATACVPFRHDGEIVSGCVGEEGVEETIEMEGEGGVINRETVSGRWCASEVDENLNAVSVIACPTILPVTEEPPPETTPINPFESRAVPKKPEYEAETEPPPPESLCVPFRYGDEIVSGCVGEQGKEEIIKTEGEGGVITWWTVKGRWCASEVDENLNPVTIILWMLMRGCVGGQWCAAEVDEDMNVMKAMSCPEISFVTESPLETTSTYEYEASAETEEPPSESSGCVPFRYGEEIVSGCLGEEGKEETFELVGEGGVKFKLTLSYRWCVSEVDENLNAMKIIRCPEMALPPMGAATTPTGEAVTGLCVPFRYGGEIVSECIGEEGKWEVIEVEREGGVTDSWTVKGKWCAAEVDKNMDIVSVIQCPMEQCVPFRYGKEIVSGCVGEEGKVETFELVGEGGVKFKLTLSYRWCVSKVDENLNAMKIIRCPEMAPPPEEPPVGAATTATAVIELPPSVTSSESPVRM
nr:uncharacterized protein LOC113802048 [Penaeus vannamei]